MKRVSESLKHIAPCAALIAAAGMATPAAAVDKHWTCNVSSAWSTPSCWSPIGQPGALDFVNIGNVAGVHNTTVRLDINETVNNIEITDGMTLDTNGSTLDVNLEIYVSGRNTVGNTEFPSRFVVEHIIDGPEVFTSVLTVRDEAEIQLLGGGVFINSSFDIEDEGTLRGTGTVTLDSNFRNLVNDGVIIAGPGALTFYQTGTGFFDLDGTSGGGDLDLTSASGTSLTFQGGGVFEAFGGTLSMIRGTVLHMNLDEPWAVENTGSFDIYGPGSGGPARITGMPLNFNGTINLYGGSQFQLDADVTFGAASELVTGLDATADIAGDAVLNGGLFIINEGSNLDFDGATTINAGAFITHSDEATTGAVDFNGATNWSGTISVTGYVRQNGPAHVTGPTIINGDTFDMDGSDNADWDIDANLTLNVDRIDFSGNTFNNTLDIGAAGRINVDLTEHAYWTVAGTMNLANNNLLFATKVGNGSPINITGVVNVSGKNDIAAGAIVASSSTINIPAATSALRFMSSTLVGAGVTFTGGGMLQNGGNGTMTINSGLNTGGVGLGNAGTLRVGSGAGIISVDRFQTTGVWNVDIGGQNAGTEHDRVVSNGPATLGGTLEVDLINSNLGVPFQPAVGDEFTILNAVGGITGAFAPDVTSTVGDTTYHWDVIIGAADVTLRLASIELPCRADFNEDGVVNSQDFFDFLTAFFAGAPTADFNADAVTNSQDFFDFLTVFFSGC
jgi:hypothetical protein